MYIYEYIHSMYVYIYIYYINIYGIHTYNCICKSTVAVRSLGNLDQALTLSYFYSPPEDPAETTTRLLSNPWETSIYFSGLVVSQ